MRALINKKAPYPFILYSVSLVLLSVMFFSGCTTRRYRNPYEYQPLVGPGKRAKADMIYRSFVKGLWIDFKWDMGTFDTIDADEVVSTCEQYLESNGFEPESVMIRRNEFDAKAHPWEYWTIRSSLDSEDLQEDEAYLKEEFANQHVEFYAKLHVIVCLKPVVIVSLDQPVVKYHTYMRAFNGSEGFAKEGDYGSIFTYRWGSVVLYSDSGKSVTAKFSYAITDPEGKEIDTSDYDYSAFYWQTCRGYGYGTRIPYKKDITWFSPELDVLPTEPEFVSDDVRRIKVPWGWLVLEHKGDEWIVKGVKK